MFEGKRVDSCSFTTRMYGINKSIDATWWLGYDSSPIELRHIMSSVGNILSLSQLFWKGYDIQMKSMHLWLRYSSNNLIVKVHMTKNMLFTLNIKTIDAKCLKDNVQDDSWCWHMRFGHLNFEAL